MKTTATFFTAAVLLLATTGSALADVHYVDLNSTNATPPYTNWAAAATNIQDAVDAAVAGDEIVVTSGIYASGGRNGNRVAVDKPLTLRSVNDAQSTIIDGGGSVRSVYLTNGDSLSGFTLTNGVTHDRGGGAHGGTLNNCTLAGNFAIGHTEPHWIMCGQNEGIPRWCLIYDDVPAYGGGAYGCILNNCTLTGNSGIVGDGGGAYSCILNNCTLAGNSGTHGGGAFGGELNNCTLSGNSASEGGGAYSGTLNNCALTGNSTSGVYTFGGGATFSNLNNCTLTGNSSAYGGGASRCTLNDCIVYFNAAGQGANYFYGTLNYSCTMPQPTDGTGNITNAPLFVDLSSGNLRLQSNSPCINAGNNACAPAGPDLDGNPRIVGGTVDIGAYEFQSPASMISYAWLQQFNLPINPATDTADPDGDGVTNYREWLAGSDPTNPFSFPPLLTLIPYGPNVILTWPTNAFGFTLQATTNLGSPLVWSTNSPAPVVIAGQNVIINPLSGPQQFYRLRGH